MKGITPVVATILLLLITIAVVGFAFGYFSTIMTSTGETAQEQAEATTGRLSKTISIDNVNNATGVANVIAVTVRNAGTAAILTTEVSFYVDNVVASSVSWGAVTSIAAGSIATANVTSTGGCKLSTSKVKAAGPANDITKSCF
jgi:flagellin-like protein